MPNPRTPFRTQVTRFFNAVVETERGCWELPSFPHARHGYVFVSLGRWPNGQRAMVGHRFAWLLLCGPLPDEAHLCHHCDNTGCVNPAHCFVGDASANQIDCALKGRASAALLNPDKVREIRKRRAAGEKYKDIAASYGVKKQTIKHIMAGRTWAYVKD